VAEPWTDKEKVAEEVVDSLWLAEHDAAKRAEWEAGMVELARDVLTRSKGRRWYAACRRDENGWLNLLEARWSVRAAAEADVARWRAQEAKEGGEPDRIVVATKLEYPWAPVNENGENQ